MKNPRKAHRQFPKKYLINEDSYTPIINLFIFYSLFYPLATIWFHFTTLKRRVRMRTSIVSFIMGYVFRIAFSKIDDLQLIVISIVDMITDKKVRRFNISMNYSRLMQYNDGFDYLFCDNYLMLYLEWICKIVDILLQGIVIFFHKYFI